jgi:hypothetical protein
MAMQKDRQAGISPFLRLPGICCGYAIISSLLFCWYICL